MPTRWRRVHGGPAGVMPGGMATRVGIGVITFMLAGLFLSTILTSPDDAEEGAPEELAGVGGLTDRLRARLADEQRRQEMERELSDRAAAHEAEAALRLRGAAPGIARTAEAPMLGAGTARVGVARPVWMGETLTDGELQLFEALYLERVEREERSLRAPSVAQSRRGAAEVIEVVAEAAPDTVVDDVLTALGLGGAPATVETSGSVLPAPADLQRAHAAAAAARAATARVMSPIDPPGWERLYEGTFLEGVLVNQLSGEFPGPVLAHVSVPLYSADRQRVLVPRGARVLGTAEAVGNQDQSRLAVSFHRLLFPDGRWIDLRFEGLNHVGESALLDEVNRHYASTFGAAGAVGVLAGLTLQGSNPYAGGVEGFRAGAGQGVGQAATHILTRYMNRLPTITIRAGHRLRIWLTSDVLVPREDTTGANNVVSAAATGAGREP